METRLLIAWALIALLAGACAFFAWRFATRHSRKAHPRVPRPRVRTMRERWLGL
ncbi:hypothetical protein RCO27_18000 [Sphingosinicella sp. LHD-64]|uniref:hypothetical protein n=1 Tax=Sphingosinicella sp. LHD-64 TaxID=3072139 RepID=UPI00280F6222|nr:hypothetical protein [Sphingosinicella sp. LHD-64]MDQ8758123.1 hypothetical protein [Sphingosinicella sp. LHD-64]